MVAAREPPAGGRFQAAAGEQGRQFAQQCDFLLRSNRYELGGRLRLLDQGVEIDQTAIAPSGHTVWFEYKGSIQGQRPGLRRTDTLRENVSTR